MQQQRQQRQRSHCNARRSLFLSRCINAISPRAFIHSPVCDNLVSACSAISWVVLCSTGIALHRAHALLIILDAFLLHKFFVCIWFSRWFLRHYSYRLFSLESSSFLFLLLWRWLFFCCCCCCSLIVVYNSLFFFCLCLLRSLLSESIVCWAALRLFFFLFRADCVDTKSTIAVFKRTYKKTSRILCSDASFRNKYSDCCFVLANAQSFCETRNEATTTTKAVPVDLNRIANPMPTNGYFVELLNWHIKRLDTWVCLRVSKRVRVIVSKMHALLWCRQMRQFCAHLSRRLTLLTPMMTMTTTTASL